jgi:hypothetical protein
VQVSSYFFWDIIFFKDLQYLCKSTELLAQKKRIVAQGCHIREFLKLQFPFYKQGWHSFFYLICLLKVLKVYSIHPHGIYFYRGPSWSWSYGSWIYNYLCLSVLTLWVRILLRRGVPDTTLCDKLLLVTGWWFSPVSSTNKTDCQLKYCWKWH